MIAGRAGGGLHHLGDVGAMRMLLWQTLQHEPAEADDRRHHVIDLVRQTTGQIADRFYALSLAQVVGSSAFVLYVDAGAHPLDKRAVGAEHGNASRHHPTVLAVGAHQPVLRVIRFLPLECPPPYGMHRLPIMRMYGVEPTGTSGRGGALARCTPPRTSPPG